MSISNVLGQERELAVPDGTIRYRESGSGEPLIFTHGLGVNGDLWRKVVPRLSKDFRCITPDWPLGSHSVPMAPDADLSLPGLAKLVVDFMDAAGLETATIVGNDTGGAVAQWVAVQNPERVDRLVLNSCDIYERFLPPQFKPLQLMGSKIPGSIAVFGQLMRARPMQWIGGFGLALKNGMPERVIMDSYVRPARESSEIRRDVRKFLAAVDPRYTLESAEKLKRFEKPVLVVWGADDRLFPLDYPRRFTAALPNARLEVVPDACTFTPEDQPEALAKLIAGFVREPQGAAA
jgi:pimeloyl-ACP methyl ester carboxylesterase